MIVQGTTKVKPVYLRPINIADPIYVTIWRHRAKNKFACLLNMYI